MRWSRFNFKLFKLENFNLEIKLLFNLLKHILRLYKYPVKNKMLF